MSTFPLWSAVIATTQIRPTVRLVVESQQSKLVEREPDNFVIDYKIDDFRGNTLQDFMSNVLFLDDPDDGPYVELEDLIHNQQKLVDIARQLFGAKAAADLQRGITQRIKRDSNAKRTDAFGRAERTSPKDILDRRPTAMTRKGTASKSDLGTLKQKFLSKASVNTLGFTKQEILRSYRRNEQFNNHTGNALMLALLFGTPQDQLDAAKLKAIAEKENGIDTAKWGALYNKVQNLHSRLYAKLVGMKDAAQPAIQEAVSVHVGDYVHAGFAVKGGAGFSGKVDKIDGNWVYVNLGKDKSVRFSNDPNSNWGDRIIKAPLKNVTLQEEQDNSKYEEYFRAMLKKHGYDSPADIPEDKKDDFFKAVDAGYQAKNESVNLGRRGRVALKENDDVDMMKSQLKSIVDRAQSLHNALSQNPPSDVEAWTQAKVTDADTAITSLHDYFMYSDESASTDAAERAGNVSESSKIVEADQPKDAMVPLRMQAAMVIAKSLGTVKGTGQSTELRVSGSSPDAIVNQAIRVWLSGSHTPEGWALGAKMLKLAKSIGIKWDEKLVRQKLAPITLKKLGLDEAEASNAPSSAQQLQQRQSQETLALDRRHEREKAIDKEKTYDEKIRVQQLKQAEKQ